MADSNFDPGIIGHYLFNHDIVTGARTTVELAILAQSIGVILGVLAALGKTTRIWPLRFLAEFYIWVFRGTPVFVQLIIWFAGLPTAIPALSGFSDPFQVALVALSLNEGSYMAEIVRAGLQAVDPGQAEAAQSLGMGYGRIMRRIILPQAARVIVPPTGNEFISMLKTTSLAAYIALPELTQRAQNISSCSNCAGAFHNLELLIVASIWYLAMTTIFSVGQAYVESRLGDRRGREDGFFAFAERVVSNIGASARR